MIMPQQSSKNSGLWQQATLLPIALVAIEILVINGGMILDMTTSGTSDATRVLLMDSPHWFLLTGLVLGVLEILTYRFLVKLFAKRPVTELGATGCIKETALGILVGSVLVSLPMLILWARGFWRFNSFAINSGILKGIGIGLIACVFEELLMRGVFLRLLEQKWGAPGALVVTSLVFGAMHLSNPGVTWLGALTIGVEAGFLLGTAYLWKRRLWFPIGLHFGWNAMQAAFWGGNVSGTGKQSGLLDGTLHGPTWLTGGSVGIEGSLLTAVIGLLAAGVIWKLTPREAPEMAPHEAKNPTDEVPDTGETPAITASEPGRQTRRD